MHWLFQWLLILFTIFRFSFRAMLAGCILVHAITLLAIKRQKYLITPQILHDGDSTRKSRHNRAMVTLKAVGAFLLFYLFAAGVLFIFSTAKRKLLLQLWKQKFFIATNFIFVVLNEFGGFEYVNYIRIYKLGLQKKVGIRPSYRYEGRFGHFL